MKQNQSNIIFRVGVALLIAACLLWLSLIIIPFLAISNTTKAAAAAIVIIVGEVAFWFGAVCTGKEFIQRYKKHLTLGRGKGDKRQR